MRTSSGNTVISTFQYPQSDRGRCNVQQPPDSHRQSLHFQYPQSDRGRCNPGEGLRGIGQESSFSILSRIVGAATLDRATYTVSETQAFSILSRIVGAATTNCGQSDAARTTLSVSSVGSWALQRWSLPALGAGQLSGLSVSSVGSWALQPMLASAGLCSHPPLSVSSVGSWALQLTASGCFPSRSGPLSVSSVGSWALQLWHGVVGDDRPPQHFQYPQSDRGRCNFHPLKHIHQALSSFQYPQSDRGRCNRMPILAGWLPRPPLSVSSVGSWALQRLH